MHIFKKQLFLIQFFLLSLLINGVQQSYSIEVQDPVTNFSKQGHKRKLNQTIGINELSVTGPNNIIINYPLELYKKTGLDNFFPDKYNNFNVRFDRFLHFVNDVPFFIQCTYLENGYNKLVPGFSINSRFINLLIEKYKKHEANQIGKDFSVIVIAPLREDSDNKRTYSCTFLAKIYMMCLDKTKPCLDLKEEPSTNGMGDVVYGITALLSKYLVSIKAGDKVLDIGTASGNNTLLALARGVHIIVANDISPEALEDVEAKIEPKYVRNVLLNYQRFPNNLEQEIDFFDKILLSHVIHYLSEEEIISGVNKLYKWLKPGGRVFLQSLSPYSLPFFHGTKAIIKNNLNSNELNEEALLWAPSKDCSYLKESNMPDFSHPITPSKLQSIFQNAGFFVDYINYNSFNSEISSPITFKEHELYVKHDSQFAAVPHQRLKLQEIKKKLSTLPKMRRKIKRDRREYHSNHKGKDKQLSTMAIVGMVAYKKERE